ncbi:MAG TPA: HD domain-containing protein [Thermoanaerobaculia bacterium]|jgi:putative hydrolase of HD superfamily|nr:HD domain-containing protein [Thermoanaerobaculia bacterium]
MEPRSEPSDVQRIFDFVVELDKLKAVLRRARPVGLERYENSAEHSWHVAVVAMLLAKHSVQPVDLQRVLEILLVHDIPEIDCGDQFVYTRDTAQVAVAEAAAAERIFGLLPPAEGEWLLSRWREYEERQTPEAKLAYAADRLMPVLHNVRGGARSWRENDVPLTRVKEVTRAIGDACPAVWAEVEPLIESFFVDGVLADRKS